MQTLRQRTPNDVTSRQPDNRFFNGSIAVISAVAALGTAWFTLRPPDREDFARFTSVTVASGVLYSEYQQRSIPPHPATESLGLGATNVRTVLIAATPTPTPDDTSSPTAKPSPAQSRSGTPTPRGKLLDRRPAADAESMRLAPANPVPDASKAVRYSTNQCLRQGI
jgi:hypothetical protein